MGKHVAKLVILRGAARHGEVELTGQTLRIGRSAQNEIVLDDPGKGVSRTHAEIRLEGGRYTLIDLESQNGIWVAGSRVSSVVLGPDVVASVGPFRLMIEAPVAAAATFAADTPVEFTPLPEQPTGPLLLGGLGEATAVPAPRSPVPRPPRPRQWYERPRTWLIGGAAALLIALLGFAAFTVTPKKEPTFDLARARVMVDGGNCQQALVEHVEPALTANRDDPEALELRRRCTAPPPPPPAPTPQQPLPTTQELDAAESLVAGNECAAAVDRINAVLAADPNNERARELAARANACVTPTPALPTSRTPADTLAVSEPPAEGGLDPLPKELQKDYLKRKVAMRKRYDDAVSRLEGHEYQYAARELEEIAQQVPSGYLDLSRRRAEARDGIKAEAGASVDEAQAAERAGDFEAAIAAYRRAHALDPSFQVDGHLQRIDGQKLQRGNKRCEEGRLAFSYGDNAAAAAAFQDVVKLLPPSDPCYATARDRLKQLGK